MKRGDPVLLDTNVVIEAVRTNRWNAISGGLTLETVKECESEIYSGKRWQIEVPIPPDLSDGFAAIHDVSESERAALYAAAPRAMSIDAGERDLLAHALARRDPGMWVLASPDKAAIATAVQAGIQDQLVSLEQILNAVGVGADLRFHFTTSWLTAERTKALLGG